MTNQTLTNEQLINIAPAVNASMPYKEVSARYSFVPTIEVVNILRNEGWLPVAANQSNVRTEEREGFQKHMVRFCRECLNFKGERVDLVLYNSHDRGSSFNLIASIWRKICGNGLMVSSDLFNFSHKHINFDPDSLIESAYAISEGAAEIADEVEDMKTIELTPDERGVYAMAAHQLVYNDPETAPISSSKLLEERRYDDNGNDLWTTFNVVQENIIRGGLYTDYNYRSRMLANGARKPMKRTRKVKSIDKNIKLNKALWTLTEKMAELKN